MDFTNYICGSKQKLKLISSLTVSENRKIVYCAVFANAKSLA